MIDTVEHTTKLERLENRGVDVFPLLFSMENPSDLLYGVDSVNTVVNLV